LACHAPKIFKEDCQIDWTKPGNEINNFIRGLSPYPTAFTQLKNGEDQIQLVKIFNSKFEIFPPNHPNGLLLTDNKTYLKVFCEDGLIEVTEIQLQGKKKIGISEFLRGFKVKDKAMFL
jgi:methionyl-tRNA formyltransferase